VRTCTLGQSVSALTPESAVAPALSVVAFDDELNRSSGDDLKMSLVELQPPSASAAASAVHALLRRQCRFVSPRIFWLAFLVRTFLRMT
jgi:hypothetical protein